MTNCKKFTSNLLHNKCISTLYTPGSVADVFYSKTDKAHQSDHILSVIKNVGTLLNHERFNTLGRNDIISAYCAALYHDIYSTKKDRKSHHTLAAEFFEVYGDTLVTTLGVDVTEEALAYVVETTAKAIRYHRKSIDFPEDEVKGGVVDLVRCADKGPVNFDKFVDRLIQSRLNAENKVEGIEDLEGFAVSAIKDYIAGRLAAATKHCDSWTDIYGADIIDPERFVYNGKFKHLFYKEKE